MSLNVKKDEQITLETLQIAVGLDWEFTDCVNEFDADVSLFALNDKCVLPDPAFFVFYNNLSSPDGAIKSEGDECGDAAEDFEEMISIDLSVVDPQVTRIVLAASIFEFERRRQNFGQLSKCRVTLVDRTNQADICSFNLHDYHQTEGAVEIGAFFLSVRERTWHFEAIGRGVSNGLSGLVTKYSGSHGVHSSR